MDAAKTFNKYQAAIVILGGIVATAVTLTAYAFTTFQTKQDTASIYELINNRFDRLENKIDDLLTRRK